LLGVVAVICFLAWTFVSAPAHGESNAVEHHDDAAFIIADTKLKDFPDFDDKESGERGFGNVKKQLPPCGATFTMSQVQEDEHKNVKKYFKSLIKMTALSGVSLS
jgi:hypothetical protein